MCFLARKICLNEPVLSPAGLLTWQQKSEQGEAFPKAQSKGHRGKAVEYEVWSVSERLVLGLIFLLLYFKYLCRTCGQHKQSLDWWCSQLTTVPGEQGVGKLGRCLLPFRARVSHTVIACLLLFVSHLLIWSKKISNISLLITQLTEQIHPHYSKFFSV